jgi:hypothetical protein
MAHDGDVGRVSPWKDLRRLCTHLSKEGMMDDTGAQVIDLIFGRWRSQILYTGVGIHLRRDAL